MSNRYYSKRLRVKGLKKANKRGGNPRSKSFKTEEAANKWAEKNKIKSYILKNLKSSESKKKKIVVVKK